MTDDDDDHALSDLLRERLPPLGLDYDTYGPYVLPLLTDEEADPEEWDSVLELLQASSESHSDDEQVWKVLRDDIQKAWAQHRAALQQQHAAEKEQQAKKLQQALAEERRLAQEAAAQAAQTKQSTPSETDAAKQALLDRFGYDNDDQDGNEETTGGSVLTNQQAAAAAQQEKMNELRSHKGQTKKEEQQKTSQAKKEKAQLKEDRRKKTVKGERKRG